MKYQGHNKEILVLKKKETTEDKSSFSNRTELYLGH